MFERNVGLRSAYRSVRYNINRKDSQTADPTSLPKFRIKKNHGMESTFYKTVGFQTKANETMVINPQQTSYLQTLQSLSQNECRLNKSERKQWASIPSKVVISDFNHQLEDNPNTEFTLLDVFAKPHDYIAREIPKLNKQIHEHREDLKIIRCHLHLIKFTVNNDLKNTQDEAIKAIEKLRNLIKHNDANQIERKLKVKKQISNLKTEDEAYKHRFEETHERLRSLQQQIFNCEPFELKMNENQTGQSLYF